MTEQEKKQPFIYRNYVRWPLIIMMILVVVLGLTYSFFIDPVKSSDATLPCFTYTYLGIYCPGCGDTRALHALMHGHILRAFDYNLLFPFIVVILAWYYLVGLTTLIRRKRVMWIPETVPLWVMIGGVSVIVLFTVLRNIPYWPFTILAP